MNAPFCVIPAKYKFYLGNSADRRGSSIAEDLIKFQSDTTIQHAILWHRRHELWW